MKSELVDVDTEHGPVRGCKKVSILGRDYFNFQKIPYMKAPVGKLRFTEPQTPESWSEPLDCTQEGSPFCNVNFMNGQYEGQLNAMFINVYTNNIQPTKSYPVLVCIHGGGVFTGSSSTDMYSLDYFMQKDVVIVTFQYRIGVFGFLSLDDPSLNVPGNAQFRDHILALKWIKKNIEKFGGDPNNVTLFSESWGGGSTNYHMISDASKDLFHRGILMSGSALNSIYSIIPRRQWALKLCIELGYAGPTEDKHLLEFLENADEKEVVLASSKILKPSEMANENLIVAFGPTIEPYNNGNAFITDDIVKMARYCWGNKINILIGATSNECTMIEMMTKVEEEYKKITTIKRYVPIELELDDKERSKCEKMLLKNYYGMLKPTKTSLEGLMQLMNDNALWHPMSRIIKSREKSGKGGKTFVYRFDIDSDNNLSKKVFNSNKKYREPVHGDDVCYIFKNNLGTVPAIDSAGFKGIKLMLSVFSEFALNGNPNVPELGEGVEWTAATFDEPLTGINIDENKCEILKLPEADRVKVFVLRVVVKTH